MSLENVEVVRRIYAAWEEQGSPGPSGLLDPAVEWVNSPDPVGLGDIDEMLDMGDRVVVLATPRGGGRPSGAEVERRQGYLWTLRDGKAVRFEWFDDADEALRAAGVHC